MSNIWRLSEGMATDKNHILVIKGKIDFLDVAPILLNYIFTILIETRGGSILNQN